MSKKLIYFPSFTSLSDYLKKDSWLIENELKYRFYDDLFHKENRWKYFLITAGSEYKKENARKNLGIDNGTIVLGDSGGFQITTGVLKYSDEIKVKIFNWLENNSDYAMNLDIPPKGLYNNRYQESLDMSLKNFKYFNEHQSGKTKFLNVLQGNNYQEIDKWYSSVKVFEFKGWGLGGVLNLSDIMLKIAFLLEKKEFEKPNNELFHFLGSTSPIHFLLYSILQKEVNKKLSNTQISTDSSSPIMSAVFGNWYHHLSFNTLSYKSLYFGNKGKTNYVKGAKLPCLLKNCAVCDKINYDDIAAGNIRTRDLITYHNFFFFQQVLNQFDTLAEGHVEAIKDLVSSDYYIVFNSLIEMINSNKPIEVYNKYKNLYTKLEYSEVNIELANEFFEF